MDNDKILWAKIKPAAIIPSKREEDAGYDIYACFEEDKIVINTHETVMIPTGIASAFSPSFVAILKERGSTGTKGIGQRAGIIDSGYRGEWLVPLTNHNNDVLIIAKNPEKEASRNTGNPVIIYPASKAICQALFLPLPSLISEEISYDELLKITSERGNGRLGSSGK